MEAVEALKQANQEFASRLREIEPDDWGRPTPCAEWDVRALVNHMLLGTRMANQLLSGLSREEVIAQLNDDLLIDGVDPVEAFERLADEMVAGFSGPGGLDGTVSHPGGDFPRSVFIGFRIGDSAVHAWDLATAIGADTTLDEELVEFLWADVEPRTDMLLASGMFGPGPSGEIPDEAPLQIRYLDLLGRRP